MSKKDNTKTTFSEALKINLRMLKIVYHKIPGLIISKTMSIIWNSLTPYVGIYLSALIIGELSGAKDRSRLISLVLITLSSAAVITLVKVLLEKWNGIEESTAWQETDKMWSDKMLDMDFVDADDPKTHQMLSTIRANQMGGGWGIFRLYEFSFAPILESILSLICGIAMTITLFTARVPDSAGAYTAFNNPLFGAAVIAVMLAVAVIAPMLGSKGNSYYAQNAGTHNLANRLFGFYGFIGMRGSEYAPDIRIYRIDKTCKTVNDDKTGTFLSKGPFAKIARTVSGVYASASSAVSVIFTGCAYVYVCLKALGGAFGIGEVTQYVSSITRVAGNVSSIVSAVGDMKNNAEFLKLILEYMDMPNKMYRGSLNVEKRNDRNYEIEFRDVSFKYPGSDSYSLRHVNMKFKIGEKLAVVGQNGSGKTTFIKLLCRLYDPTEGEILLNGIDIKKYNYSEYMNVFSVVFQDFALLSYTLGENVAVGAKYDVEKVKKCLVDVGFGKRLDELEEGLDTYHDKDFSKNGVRFSGGEDQKIAIARTLYKDAPFIILDEPTAALDPVAEADIYSNFSKIVGDKTAVYISHRLSSCRFCDEILVFSDGCVVEQGTHDELLKNKNGKYYELWHAQAQYYENDEAVSQLFA
jgi:ATP-binding cassette, subfamily B, bacterial